MDSSAGAARPDEAPRQERAQRELADWLPGWLRRSGAFLVSADRREDVLHEWRRRRSGPPALPPGPIRRVVVICHGNICRSPFGAHLLTRLRPDLEVRSAGLEARDGKPAQPLAIETARRFEIDLSRHGATRLQEPLARWADLILAMEGHHLRRVRQRFPEAAARTRLLGDFLSEPPHRLLDPYGRDGRVFAEVFQRVARATEALVRVLPAQEGA